MHSICIANFDGTIASVDLDTSVQYSSLGNRSFSIFSAKGLVSTETSWEYSFKHNGTNSFRKFRMLPCLLVDVSPENFIIWCTSSNIQTDLCNIVNRYSAMQSTKFAIFYSVIPISALLIPSTVVASSNWYSVSLLRTFLTSFNVWRIATEHHILALMMFNFIWPVLLHSPQDETMFLDNWLMQHQ